MRWVVHEVIQLPEGWAGTDETVRIINRLAREAVLDPVVVRTARRIVLHVPERDKDGEIRAITEWVKRHVRYVNEKVETVVAPREMLDEIERYGKTSEDCDGHVLLWVALLLAIGHRVSTKVISQRRDRKASHIYGYVFSPTRGWIAADLIVKHRPLGWEVPAREVTKEKTYGPSFEGLGMNDVFASAKAEQDFFVPGGTAQMMVDPFLASVPRMVSRNHVPSRYNTKRGGMLEVREDGEVEAMGFIPGVVAAAAPLAKIAGKFLKKKKKKRKKGAPLVSTAAPSCPPGYYYAGTEGVDDIYEAGLGDIYEAGMGQVPAG